MYVLIKLKREMIKKHHESRIYKHQEIFKTMKYIRRNYYFSNMKKLIEKKITICLFCNQNKYARHKSYEDIEYLRYQRQLENRSFEISSRNY